MTGFTNRQAAGTAAVLEPPGGFTTCDPYVRSSTAQRGRSARRRTSPVAAAVAIGCGARADRHRLRSGRRQRGREADRVRDAGGSDKIKIPDDIKDRLKEHGIDLDKWKNGEWKNWDKDDWLREAQGLHQPDHRGPVGPGPDA